MFYIRADANPILGSGHVMRCLSIANAIKKRGQDITFITADLQSEKLIRSREYSIICLDTNWNSLEDELDQMKNLVMDQKITSLLVDSYYVTHRYLEELNKITKVSYLDDLNRFIYPVRALINYNIYAGEQNYEKNYPKDTKLLLGSGYIPLREEFICGKRENNQFINNILITTGGADPYNFAGQLLWYLSNHKEFHTLKLHIVVGPLNQNRTILEENAGQYANVTLHENVTRMSELMKDSDIAISAGGSTLYELCSCGVPTISFSYADNQKDGTIEFDRQGLIFYAGDIRDDLHGCLNNISLKLKLLREDYLYRDKLSKKMQELVDGFGADRIAEELLTE
jgi:UDP-2,4-diacetamido-2,4,6-trideoxy-beta-L-altropyranose hydrolase